MEGYVMVKVEEKSKKTKNKWKTTATAQVGKLVNNGTNQKPSKKMVSVELIPAFTINMNSIDIFDKQTWQQQL